MATSTRHPYDDVKRIVEGIVTTIVVAAQRHDIEAIRCASISMRQYIADIVMWERGIEPPPLLDWSDT